MDIGDQLLGALGTRRGDDRVEQATTNAASLHRIGHLDRDLDGHRVRRIAHPARQSDGPTVELGDDDLVPPGRDRRKVSRHLVGETRHTRLESSPDRGERELLEDSVHGLGVARTKARDREPAIDEGVGLGAGRGSEGCVRGHAPRLAKGVVANLSPTCRGGAAVRRLVRMAARGRSTLAMARTGSGVAY